MTEHRIQIKAGKMAAILFMLSLGIGLYFVSQETYRQRHVIETLSTQISQTEKQLANYEAEWAYLNSPERIANLIRHYHTSDRIEPYDTAILTSMPEIQKISPPASKPQSSARLALYTASLP